MPGNSDSILVHSFLLDTPHHNSQALLDLGRDLVHSAVDQDGWSTVITRPDPSLFRTRGRAYSYALALPTIDCGKHKPVVYSEWGEPPGADDVKFLLHDLEEFKSTNLDNLLAFSHPQKRENIEHARPTSQPSPSKRRRLDALFFHDVIPQPHYHPARLITHKFTPDPCLVPYGKSRPNPISPHTTSTIHEYLRTPYAQSAWVVPVRGILPWHECSSAIVLAPPSSQEVISPDPPQPAQENREIVWNHTSLVDFWSFLLAVRDANTLGPLALSFHCSSLPDQNIRVADHDRPLSLLAMDHIKIYHDAACAMLVRNVLDAWAYPTRHSNKPPNADDAGSARHAETKRVRVLKGAKLVLLDDHSKGLLIT